MNDNTLLQQFLDVELSSKMVAGNLRKTENNFARIGGLLISFQERLFMLL